ncbi:hypothetical protein [Microbulbifer sp. DLAB2-AA]|uniref:hypothetical protein n=1 Tax=Microbulbifer sp. DLAB2-AA TaxID=3243394 RepID=UPI004039BC64
MLFSSDKKFIFIANLKTASTSIEEMLVPYSQISFLATSCGKHMSAEQARSIVNSFAASVRYEDCFSFGVMRDPLTYALSVYNSHSKKAFIGKPSYTGSISFDEFLRSWVLEKPSWQMRPQFRRFVDSASEKPMVNYVVPFESLERGLSFAFDRLELNCVHNNSASTIPRLLKSFVASRGRINRLKRLNKSPQKLMAPKVSDWARDFIWREFSEDYAFYKSYVGKLL